MATETAPTPTGVNEPPTHADWAIAWGGAMLIVLSLWLRAKFEDLSIALPAAVGLLGALLAAFAAWQLVQGARKAPTLAAAAAARSLAAAVRLGAGGLMAVLAILLGFLVGLAGFGEYVGLGLLALAAIVGGMQLRQTHHDPDFLGKKVNEVQRALRLTLWIGGAALLAVFAWLALWEKVGAEWFPELAALLSGGFFFVGAAFWLQLQSATGALRPLQARVFVLVVGGVTGLIVTLMILIRMFMWRDRVFIGGLEVWLGEGSWRLWLCAYVLLLSLALMFGSLFLARGNVHENITLRRGLFGYTTLLHCILLVAILILANVLFYILYPYTATWTQTSFSTLSPATKGLLADLKQPVTFYVMMAEGHPATADLRLLLENARLENNRISVYNISPDQEPKKYLELAERYKEIQPERFQGGISFKRGVLIVYGNDPKEPNQPLPPHAFVADEKIFESKSDDPPGMPPQMRKGKRTNVFKAEPELMKELHHLATGKQKRKLYILQGDGELDINNRNPALRASANEPLSNYGMANFVDRLKKDDFDVQGLKFGERRKKDENIVGPEIGDDKKKEIPRDVYALIIPGASEPLTSEELDTLERYLDRGGRLVAFFEPVFDEKYTAMRSTGLEEFLKKYGVEVRPEMATRSPRSQRGLLDPRIVYATTPLKADSLLARQFAKTAFGMPTVRVVKPMTNSGRYKAESLLELDPDRSDFWAEVSPALFVNIEEYMRDVLRNPGKYVPMEQPLSVAVSVTEGSGDLAKPRMVVFGDVDFIANSDRQPAVFYDLVSGSLEWMAERGTGFIGPRPREQLVYNPPPNVDGTRLFVYPTLLMLLATGGLGAGLWIVRRR